ncbi:MAG: nicotinate-nucleotide adenylyltransferase [Tissierellia bacterium]|nr:nicotinate-nucleotide adenylyltransferase [Tissierellia bacterium]
MKIGILGGSFDPIHMGHLILGENVRDSLKLDKVIFIPTGINPFKGNRNTTSPTQRLEMIKLAIESNPHFTISTIEIEREGISYTIDTIKSLKGRYKEDDLYFIIGSDIIFQIEKWKDIQQLFKLCKFALVNRPGKELKEIDNKVEELSLKYNIFFERISSPFIDISSTDIRNRVRKKQSIKYLVPPKVEDYIIKHKLYVEEV